MNKAEYDMLKREQNRIVQNLGTVPTYTIRVATKLAKVLLMGGPYIVNGRTFDVKAKNLGAGVHEISRKEI